MAAPDKTSETLNLAEALNANPSTSGSNDANVVSQAKSKDDDLNANLSDITKRFNDIDMSFRQKVITQESSSDFIDNSEDQPHSTAHATAISHPKKDEATIETIMKGLQIDDEEIQFLNQDNVDDSAVLEMLEQDDDRDWKKNVGSVYNRMMDIQKTGPKKHNPKAFAKKEEPEVENIQVLPEVINCPKCNRKVAAGAINYHVKFCNPDHIQ